MATLGGSVRRDIARLHRVFEADFKRGRPAFGGMPLWWDRALVPGTTFEAGFWHIVTREDPRTGVRRFDPFRAERLPWCAPTILNANDAAVKVWNYRKTGKLVRTYVWLEHHDYLITLQQKRLRVGPVVFLVSAFHVDGPWMRKQLRQQYASRIR